MYSLHSFLGAITLFMLSGQYFVGLGSFLILREKLTPERRAAMAGWHAFFGKATFTGGLMSCIVSARFICLASQLRGLSRLSGDTGVAWEIPGKMCLQR